MDGFTTGGNDFFNITANSGKALWAEFKVRATCAGDVLAIKIDPSIIDPTDAEFLEELVLKGVQDAISQGKAQAAAEMSKLTGGLGIPGL